MTRANDFFFLENEQQMEPQHAASNIPIKINFVFNKSV